MGYGTMGTMFALASATCAACSLWLGRPGSVALRVRTVEGMCIVEDDDVPTTLILAMFVVVLRQGASIPRACTVIGDAVGGEVGGGLRRASVLLARGVDWDDAWRTAHDETVGDMTAGDETSSHSGPSVLPMLCEVLEPSWRKGTSPIMRLEGALDQFDTDERSRIETAASRLGVRLLMPIGLCFLPAFIFIGVIPSIVSFAM